MNVMSQTTEIDGSAWVAVVIVSGVIYRASFVANKLVCNLGPYKHAPRRPRWALESVRAWAEKQIAALPSDWMKMHREMYAA